ncbi:MAG: hypothetical protein KC964_02030 [Candidatus Omnitrophica bacterium]|nr:hypothetical protein [Candidatus Omnitrophota bacterium]
MKTNSEIKGDNKVDQSRSSQRKQGCKNTVLDGFETPDSETDVYPSAEILIDTGTGHMDFDEQTRKALEEIVRTGRTGIIRVSFLPESGPEEANTKESQNADSNNVGH